MQKPPEVRKTPVEVASLAEVYGWERQWAQPGFSSIKGAIPRLLSVANELAKIIDPEDNRNDKWSDQINHLAYMMAQLVEWKAQLDWREEGHPYPESMSEEEEDAYNRAQDEAGKFRVLWTANHVEEEVAKEQRAMLREIILGA